MKKIIITKSQLDEIYNTPQLKKIQRRIYSSVSDYCGKMHSDSGWQDVTTLIDLIKSVNGVTDVYVGAGQYSNYTNPENGACRDYETTVETEYGNLYGYIRCHAAGTMDDIFKYYDMTISLYPDKKRDMNEEKSLREDINVAVTAKNNSGSDYLNALKNPNTLKDIQQAKAITPDVNAVVSGPKTDDNSPSIDCDVPAGSTVSDVMNKNPEINSAVGNKSARLVVHGDGFPNEAKVYTKRDVEIARLYEMRRNGKVLTKQQLKEEILGETEDIGEFIRNKNVFDVLEAVGEVFGQDVLQSLSTSWDMSAKIVEIYNNADDTQKEEFKRRIEGDTSDGNDDENLIDLDFDIPDMDVFKN